MKKNALTHVATEVIKRPSQPGSLHIFEFSHARADDRQLVVLVEIEISDKDNEVIIEDMANEIEHQFFNAPAQEPEYAFENALAKANNKIKDTLLEKPKNWLNRIHVVVLAICGTEVHMASVGSVHAFLVHHEKVVDVLKSPQQNDPTNPIKLFTNIVSGKLNDDTALVLTNESVLDYLSVERIRKSAEEFGAHEAIQKLVELLARAPEHKQFGLAVISRIQSKVPEPEKRRQHTNRPVKSDDTTIDLYEDVEEKQKTTIEPDTEPRTISRFEPDAQTMNAITSKAKQLFQLGLTLTLSFLAKLLEALQRIIKRGIPVVIGGVKTIRSSISSSQARTYFWTKIKKTLANISRGITSKPKSKKHIAGLGVLVLIVLFVASVSVRALGRSQDAQNTNRELQLQTIEQKVTEAEASLIYGNKTKSLALLAEAQTLLATLENEFPDEQNYQSIRQSITEIQNKSEKKKLINNIKTIATIIPQPISAGETGLVRLGELIYFYDGIQEKIASIDVQNELVLSLALVNQGITSFDAALELTNSEIAALTRDTVLIIDSDDETIQAQQFSYDPGQASPFASYAGNLYTFDTAINQIIRYRRAGAGFTSAQNWLTQEYELATMRDISVDGFVYLLDSKGTIHVFLRGAINKTLPWPASDLPGDGIRFYTTEESDSFYILDPENQRITHSTKQGELVVQLVSPILQKATDLVTDESEENLFVLAGDKIYQIPISQ